MLLYGGLSGKRYRGKLGSYYGRSVGPPVVRLHHPPVRSSVPTWVVGTLVPHGKAGVFALNLYISSCHYSLFAQQRLGFL